MQNSKLNKFLYAFLFISCVFVNISPTIAQESPVHDPQNLLSTISSFLPQQEFDQIFSCGSNALFYTPVIKATFDFTYGIQVMYESNDLIESQFQIYDCVEDSAVLYTDLGTSYFLSKVDYEKFKKNYAHLWLSRVGEFLGLQGKVNVLRIEKTKYRLENGTELDAHHIFADFLLLEPQRKMDFLITVAHTPHGVAQIARFRLMNETWFRLKNIPPQNRIK